MGAPSFVFSVADWVKQAMVRAGFAVVEEEEEPSFSPTALGVAREAIRLGGIAKGFAGSEYEKLLHGYLQIRMNGLDAELEAGSLTREGYVAAKKLLKDVAAYPYTLLAQAKESEDQIADWRDQGLDVDNPQSPDDAEPAA